MSDELKPCGCGGKSEFDPTRNDVRCTTCGIFTPPGYSQSEAEEKWNAAMSGVDQSDEYRDRYQAVVKAFGEAYPSLVPSLENIQEVFHGVADWDKQQAEKVKRIAELERELEAERSIRKTLRERVDQVTEAIDKAGLLDDDATFLQNVQRIVRHAREAEGWKRQFQDLEAQMKSIRESVYLVYPPDDGQCYLRDAVAKIVEWQQRCYGALDSHGFRQPGVSISENVANVCKQARAAADAERYYESLQALSRDRCGSDDIAALIEELRFLRSETERPAAEEEDLSTVARELAAASGILIRTIGAQELHVQRMSRELKERSNA